ncbi:HD domain-containing phosphohydrolase [Desulfovibrio ferrophilus]|uniref:Metal dependent phosphohydrolase with GAF sensor n=1 Tax=Desulfovibrio ferrophilus TaxID=241368 RepID=A0A2Z6B0C4_9BACT|nr:HD domain-containing phosphohydrolase [Desulfovibrio ferrophilus]BBD08836.1 metal dependent phosphohydrolase with GAF sensor [Desulfovibrio ferrophilus]
MSAPRRSAQCADQFNEILAVNDRLNELKDLDAILDRVLTESRRLTNADAGTIYLLDENKLKFSYVHNDSFMKEGEINKDIYANFSIPLNDESIVGYVAGRGESLNIEDVYDMPGDSPVTFNPAFDKKTGYHTTSMLTVPIKTSQGKVSGIIQLINAKNETGKSISFSHDSQNMLPLFANTASVAIERAIMTRELILRMMQMAELRDPTETGPHVTRVGTYCAEIYHKYAMMKGLAETERKKTKDLIRVASMLHDVGKVGISDKILKKPAKLDNEEFAIMQFHTVYGAKLFVHSTSELDAMSGRIALGHHEKWSGRGYPGKITALTGEVKAMGESLVGEAIPLEARICALADVFDALGSRRSYKPPWPDEKIIGLIKEERGQHFDPDVVDAFLDIFDVITAIRDKYTEDLPEDEKPNPQSAEAKKAAEAQDKERGKDNNA